MKKKQFLTLTVALDGVGIESIEEISHFLGELFPVGHDGQVLGKGRVVDVEEVIVSAIE